MMSKLGHTTLVIILYFLPPRRVYIFEIKCPDGPGLNFPLLSDPSGFFMRRSGHLNHYLVGKLPTGDMEVFTKGIHLKGLFMNFSFIGFM